MAPRSGGATLFAPPDVAVRGGSPLRAPLLVALLVLVPPAASHAVVTTGGAPMPLLPEGRQSPAAVWTGSEMLVLGGVALRAGQLVALADVVHLHPPASVHVASAALPEAAWSRSAVWTGSTALLFGGNLGYLDGAWRHTASILAYDPLADSAVVAGALPSPRIGTAAAWDGTYAWILGGYVTTPSGSAALDEVVRFDPATGATEVLPWRLPEPRAFGGAAFHAGRILLVGGCVDDACHEAHDDVLSVDPTTGEAERWPNRLPSPRGLHAVAAGAGTLSIVGGIVCAEPTPRVFDCAAANEVLAVDPVARTITDTGLALPGGGMSNLAAVQGDTLRIAGGSTRDGCRYCANFFHLEAENGAPIAVVAPVPVACGRPPVEVRLDGSGSYHLDPPGEGFLWSWSAPGVPLAPADSPFPRGAFPRGSTPVTLRLSDGRHADGGHASEPAARVVRVDDLPPTTALSSSGTPGLGGWWRSAVDVTLEAVDADCAVARVRHAVDGGDFVDGSVFRVNGLGVHTVDASAEDVGGNVEAPRRFEVKIDWAAPDLVLEDPYPGSVYANDVRRELPGSSAVVVVGDVTVRAYAADGGLSGVARVEFRVDGAFRAADEEAPYAWRWATGEETAGEHVLAVRAVDVAGNAVEAARLVTVASAGDGPS